MAGRHPMHGLRRLRGKGRWSWGHAPVVAVDTLCPACRRIHNRYPAGVLEISGTFAESHEREVTRLLRNVETTEGQEHPLERIMTIRHEDERVIVETTGIHLARRLGESLRNAFQGNLAVTYGEDDEHLRIRWSR